MKTILLSSVETKQGLEVTWQHELDDGSVVGPRFERRAKGSDVQAFLDGHHAAIEAEAAFVPPTPEENLLASLAAFDDATIKEALAVDDAKLTELKVKMEAAK